MEPPVVVVPPPESRQRFPGRPDLVERVAVDERVARFQSRSIKTSAKAEALKLVLSMIDLTTLEAPGAHGMDRIEFLISANPGQAPMPLSKVASGGELSRISLAIQVVAASDTEIPTLIFDEVDSGVGGGVAETVGQQLRALGKHHQVLCVTHLPQVACQAHQHLQVSKLTGDKTTRTRIRPLHWDDRVE